MYKILAALLPFIKELFFDRKEEMDFSSYRFNIKKWIIYVSFLGLFVYALISSNRLIAVTGKFIDLNKRYHKLEIVEKNDLTVIETLKDKNTELQEDAKDMKLKCLKDIPTKNTKSIPKSSLK